MVIKTKTTLALGPTCRPEFVAARSMKYDCRPANLSESASAGCVDEMGSGRQSRASRAEPRPEGPALFLDA
jgi:hypothetical protein